MDSTTSAPPAATASPTRTPFRVELRTLLALAWPLVISSSFTTVQIFVDRLFLSWYSPDAVAASLGTVMIFYVPFTLLFSTSSYVVTFVSQYLGAGQPRRTGASVWQGIWFSLASGLGFLLVLPFNGSLMALVDHPPTIRAMEETYFFTLAFAAMPMLLTASISAFFAGRGESRWIMLINVVGTLVNGVLGYGLIFGRFGLPEMGIAGAGWALVIASWCSALTALALFLRPKYREEFGTGSGWRLDRELFLRMMRFGLPSGVQWFLDCVAFTVFVVIVGWLGEVPATASSIAFTINLLSFLPVMGIGQAVTIRVGHYQGQRNPEGSVRATWAGQLIGCVYTLGVAVLYVGFPGMLTDIFRADEPPASWPEIQTMVGHLLIFISVYVFFDSVMTVFCYTLRGAGDTRYITLVSLIFSWPVMIIPTYLSYYYAWGVYAAWCFCTLYIVTLCVAFGLRFLGGRWKTMTVIENRGSEDESAECRVQSAE